MLEDPKIIDPPGLYFFFFIKFSFYDIFMEPAEINTFTAKSFTSFKICLFLDHLTICKKIYCNLIELTV